MNRLTTTPVSLLRRIIRWIRFRINKGGKRPTNFSWVIEYKLAGSGEPMTYEQVLWVVDHGIRSILTVREKRLTDSWLRSIDHHFLKVEDFDAPSVEQLDNAVGYIKKQMANGKAVLVHCSEGKGRTGTVLAAYYVKEENLTATQAIEKIKNRRPNSVESPIQKERIEAYEQYLISKKDRKGI